MIVENAETREISRLTSLATECGRRQPLVSKQTEVFQRCPRLPPPIIKTVALLFAGVLVNGYADASVFGMKEEAFEDRKSLGLLYQET